MTEEDFSTVIRRKVAELLDKIESPASRKKNGSKHIDKALVLDEDRQPEAELIDQAINHELVLIKHYVLGREAPPEMRGQSKMDIGKARQKLAAFYEQLEIVNPRATADKFIENTREAVFGKGTGFEIK
jgi:hypothetical protein